METVTTYQTAWEAHIAKGRLEAEGIPVCIADEYYIGANWWHSVALGGVRLQVPALKMNDAKVIVYKLLAGEYEIELSNDSIDEDKCPACNSEKINNVMWPLGLSFFLIVFSEFLVAPFSKYWRKCKSCQHSWSVTDQRGYSLVIQTLAVLMAMLVIFVIVNVFYYWYCRPYNCASPF